jgi:cytochrome c oxidase subunit 2
LLLIVLAAITLLGIPLLTALVSLLTERPLKPARAKQPSHDSAKAAALITFVVWALLTAAGLAAVLLTHFYAVVGSDRGEHINTAFRFLTAMAVPVAALVIAVMLYSVARRGTGDLPAEDGPAYDGRGPFPKAWLAVTAGLTLLIIIYPGLVTLDKVIGKEHNPDLVVDVQAMQWTWLFSYPDQGLQNQTELVLPVDRKVTFRITSRDVVHSFWVPAFLMKVDAIPGHTTTFSLVPTELGDYADEPLYRVQCTELCGLSHATMRTAVRVVSVQDFEDWVAQKSASAP